MPRQATADRFQFRPTGAALPGSRRGFTLAELLIVIGIIVLLISILIPVVARVRVSAQSADTASLIRALDLACQNYFTDHQAWPGPLGPAQMGFDPTGGAIDSGVPVGGAPGDGFYRTGGNLVGVMGSENLVLGLLGGLIPVDNGSGGFEAQYDPAAVGRGAVKLDPSRSPGGYSPYFDVRESDLSMHLIGDDDVAFRASDLGISASDAGQKSGGYVEATSAARDSIVPEFLDRYSSPLPILYMRASATRRVTPDQIGATEGKIIATDVDDPAGVFDQRHIAGYVNDNSGVGTGSIGGGKSPNDAFHRNGALFNPAPADPQLPHGLQIFPTLSIPGNNTAPDALRSSMNKGDPAYTYPFDARAYLLSPDTANARQSDRYVIISAGADRIYGTEDDITSFGSVR